MNGNVNNSIIASVDSDVKQLNDIAEDLYDELQKFSGALEEGTRNVLAECLGRTVVARPTLCKKLQVSKLSRIGDKIWVSRKYVG